MRKDQFFMGAAVGLATGAALVMMANSRAGERATRDIKKKADAAAKSIGEMVGNIQGSMR